MTSVLTFILLVVLAGGVGLLVVSLAESKNPTADAPATPRAETDPDGPPPNGSGGHPSPPGDPDALQNGVAPVAAGPPAPAPVPALEAEPVWELVPADASGVEDPVPEPPRRRRSSEPVPRSQIAVEGRFVDVARVSVWRRAGAVLGIVSITVVAGVVIAAVLAAAIGAAAELLNTAIG